MIRTSFATAVYPVWSRDGRRIAHTTFDGARVGRLFLRASDGTSESERLTEGPNSRYASSFTSDGTGLLFREEAGDTGLDIGIVTLGRERRLEILIKTPFNELNPELSPDGKWLAYESNQSGQNEIYVRPFPQVNAGLWQISTSGGRQPAWSASGQELFYRSPDGALMGVSIVAEPRFAASGQPIRIVSDRYYSTGPYRTYDVSRDAKRFLMIKPDESERQAVASIVVVQNWLEELKRLATQP
jgi:serine/threonine-protein kinase